MKKILLNSQNNLIGARVNDLFSEYQLNNYKRTDRLFALLMAFQWLAGIGAAIWISPLTWIGTESQIHPHVWASLILGSLFSLFPIALALSRPGEPTTRYAIAIGQMLMGALLIHLSGGRIETHFHIFGSLAFLAFYRDWRVLVPATLIVVGDHILRGVFFPQSIFGVLTASNWRWLEHAGWVVFIDIFLVISCLRSRKEMQGFAEKTTALEIAEKKSAIEIGEERYRELFENANDLIFTHDLEGNFTSVNKTSEKVTGYLRDEAVGMNVNQIIASDYIEFARGMTVKMVVEQTPVSYEMVVVARDGANIWLEVNTRLIYENGKPSAIQGIARDITERKRIGEELERTRDLALDSARLKSEFLANMSHEIRTPMNGVIGMTGLLLDTRLDNEQHKFAELIRSSGEALLSIINDILDFSKIEAGKLDFEILDFDLRETVESTVELFAEGARERGNEITSLIYNDVPNGVRGDPGRLRQILSNLAGNAIKFTKNGEVVVRVKREEESETHITLRFSVTDSGIGISPEMQVQLFNPFTQADASTTRRFGGTGLGLAISRRLVEMMDGEIGIQSNLGEGATFWFTAKFEKRTDVQLPPTFGNENQLAGLRVLIVDDNAVNREILMYQTGSWNMKASDADSGAKALEMLSAASADDQIFDFVILDLQMPVMDGFELAEKINSTHFNRQPKLLMLSSNGLRGDTDTARQVGIKGYLSKPYRQEELFNCLVAIMSNGSTNSDLNLLITRFNVNSKKVHQRVMEDVPEASDVTLSGTYRRRILVVEDNVVNQTVAKMQLERFGCRADVAANGLEALEVLLQVPYDLILMDCQMPEMDGYEATVAIRQREKNGSNHIPIIAMTAHAIDGEKEKCLAAGMDDYISKPVKKEVLLQMVERWTNVPQEKLNPLITEETSDSNLTNENNFIDVVLLEELTLGDPEMLREIIKLYLNETEQQLNKIDEAVKLQDADKLYQVAHKALGGSATCGMMMIVPAFQKLEQMGKDHCLGGAEQSLSAAYSAFDGIKKQCKELINQ